MKRDDPTNEHVNEHMKNILPETTANRQAEELKDRNLAIDPTNSKKVSLENYKNLQYLDFSANKKYYWVDDRPGEINALLATGWQVEKGIIADTFLGKGRTEVSQQGSTIVRVGNPHDPEYKNTVLMSLPIEIWEQRMADAEKERDKREKEEIDLKGQISHARLMGPRANIKYDIYKK